MRATPLERRARDELEGVQRLLRLSVGDGLLDATRLDAQHPVEPGHRVVKPPAAIAQEASLQLGSERQAAAGRAIEEPEEREVRQRGVGISPADVRVDSREPHLLDHLPPGRITDVAVPHTPDGGRKWLATLVDGQRVERMLHVATEPHIVKSVAATREGADGTTGRNTE